VAFSTGTITIPTTCRWASSVDSQFSSGVLASGVALAMVLVAVPCAHATCGDWLAHDNEPNTYISATNAVSLLRDIGDSPRPHRCTGLHCQSSPAQPATPVPPNSSSPTELLAALARSSGFVPAAHEHPLPGSAMVRTTKGFPWRIEHPPRV
jgi:hypothetical protein